MRSTKRVVHVNIAKRRELIRKRIDVFLIVGVEAKVLEQQHVAIRQRVDSARRLLAYTISSKRNLPPEQRRKMFSDRTQAVLVYALTFRPAEM